MICEIERIPAPSPSQGENDIELDALLKTLDGFYAAAFGERGWHSSMGDMRLLLGVSRVCIVDASVWGWRTVSNATADALLETGEPLRVRRPIWRRILPPAGRRTLLR